MLSERESVVGAVRHLDESIVGYVSTSYYTALQRARHRRWQHLRVEVRIQSMTIRRTNMENATKEEGGRTRHLPQEENLENLNENQEIHQNTQKNQEKPKKNYRILLLP